MYSGFIKINNNLSIYYGCEMGDGGLVGTLCATLEELYTERTGPQTHSDRVHSTQFLINFYSHSNS